MTSVTHRFQVWVTLIDDVLDLTDNEIKRTREALGAAAARQAPGAVVDVEHSSEENGP